MTHPLKSLAIVAALSLTLPGCSAWFGSDKFARAGGDKAPKSQQAANQERPSVFTNMGRRALDYGNTGLAIEAFRRAVASGEDPAPAVNGLGVAYARIGRVDLAQRFFEQAAGLAPNEPRYQANLTRLFASPLFARRHDGDRAEALLAAATPSETPAQPAAPGRLQRLGANQFYIQTAAPAATGPAPRLALVSSRTTSQAQPRVAAKEVAESTQGARDEEARPRPRTVLFKPAVIAAKP